jgi:hypothetical protein
VSSLRAERSKRLGLLRLARNDRRDIFNSHKNSMNRKSPNFIKVNTLRQRSILNPDSSPLFDTTKGGITRVATNNDCWSFGDCWGSGFWASPGDAINNNARIPPANPMEVYRTMEHLVLFLG